MKLKSLALLLLIVGASCSSPKYTYNFSYYDYQAGKKNIVQPEKVIATEINSEVTTGTATTNSTAVLPEDKAPLLTEQQNHASLNTTEKKTIKKEIKKTINTYVKQVKKMEAKSVSASGWDRDLKLAAIFGAIGLGLGLLYSVNSIIGFIGFASIVIALFFLIRWLMRQ